MNTYGIYDEDLYDDDQVVQAQRKYNRQVSVTQEQADYASNLVTQYPNLSPSLVVGMTKLGLDVNDPKVQEILLKDYFAKQESNNRLKESIWDKTKDKIKEPFRYAFAGFQAAWEGGAPRLVRYLEARQQGQSHQEARKNTYTGLGAALLKEGLGAELGTGILPGITDVEETDEYKNLISNGTDPQKAREYVLNNVLDQNVYQLARQRAEQGVQFVGERAEKFREAGLDPTVTIGRYFFKPFDKIVEPGTEAYNIITGVIDAAAQLFLDPTAIATLGISKVRKGKQVFATIDQIKGFEQAGLVNGVRKTLLGPTTQQFLSSNNGRKFKEFLWENADNPGEIISRTKEGIKSHTFLNELSNLKKANPGSFDEVGNSLVTNLLDDATLLEVTRGYVPKKIKQGNRLTKAMEKTYGPRIVVSDKDTSMVQLNRFINLATKDVDTKKDFLTKAMVALDEKDSVTAVNNLLVDTLENTMRVELTDVLKPEVGSRTEQWIKESTSVFSSYLDDVDEARDVMGRYVQDSSGNGLPINDFLKKQYGIEAELLARPTTTTQLATEVYLPNPTEIIKATKILNSKLGKYGANIINNLPRSATTRFLDSYYSNIWKPLVLLRPAWTTRVILEEQLRLITAGVASGINHPLSFIASMFKKEKGFFYPEVGLLGSFENNASMADALTTQVGSLKSLKRKWGKTSQWRILEKGIDKEWGQSAFRNVMQLYFDPLSKKLAKIQTIDDTVERATALKALKDEVIDQSTSLNKKIQEVTSSKSHPFFGAGKDKELTDEFIDYLNANIAATAGGVVEANSAVRASQWIKQDGDKRLLDFIASEDARFLKKEFENLTDIDKAKYWAGELDTDTYNAISERLVSNQKKVIKDFIQEFGEVLPAKVRGELEITAGIENKYNAVVDKLFNSLMAVPTNKLSRAPAFKSFYWQSVAQNAKFATDDVLQAIIKQADEAGLAKGPKELQKLYKQITSAKGNVDGINDLQLFDKVASADALGKTKDLLYDVTTKSRLGNATRSIFPFGEAYVEIFTTWAKLINAETGRPLRRVQQVVEAGRKPNPVFDETGQKGFFYKNPKNGQEVFGYPGEGLLQKWMFSELEEGGVNVNMPVYLSSVNIAANVLPGFGPTIQIPAAYLNSKGSEFLKEEGILQNLIFGDFAPPRVGTFSELFRTAIPFPSWLQKIGRAYSQESDEAKRQFANTTIDVYKAMLYAGLANDSNPEAAQISLDQATEYAKKIMLIRGISQLLGPSGIATPEYELTDKNGNLYLFEQLADEYRNIKTSVGGDDSEATAIFIERFGLDPVALVTSKSQSIKKRPMTVDGANWARENKELYEKFDLTAWYINPTDESEFSYDAYYNALLNGDLQPRSSEEWLRAKNKLLGSIEYENFLRKNELHNRSDKVASTAKANKQKELMSKYWGYGRAIPQSIRKPENEEIIAELYTWFDPVTYELVDEVKEYDAAKALALYAKERDRIIKRSIELGYTESSWKQSKSLLPFRTHLRGVADKLFLRYPEFEAMYRDILEVELREEYQDIALIESLGK
jgi:hypothetical protein